MENSEKLYTLSQAEKILNERNIKRQIRKKKLLKYYIIQKTHGLVLLFLSIIMPFLTDGDATIGLLLVPIGFYLLFTKKKVVVL